MDDSGNAIPCEEPVTQKGVKVDDSAAMDAEEKTPASDSQDRAESATPQENEAEDDLVVNKPLAAASLAWGTAALACRKGKTDAKFNQSAVSDLQKRQRAKRFMRWDNVSL